MDLRGSKLLITSLAIASTLSGWAWLAQAFPVSTEFETVGSLIVDEAADAGAPLLATTQGDTLPNLADLPVRGLRTVGNREPQMTSQTEIQPAPPAVSAPANESVESTTAPHPRPQAPRPEPVRKTRLPGN